MTSSPIISVIVPAFNAENHLKRCLDSIIAQEMTEWECIVIDDGSTDKTGQLADEYAANDSRFRVFHKENGGVSSARNIGLKIASGIWLVFVDADDFIVGRYFPIDIDPEMNMLIQNWKFYGTDGFTEFLERGSITKDQYNGFLKENAHKDIFRGVLSKFVKKSIVDKYSICFDERQRLGEDTLFFMEYARYCSCVQIMDGGCYIYDRRETDWVEKYDYSPTDVISFFQAFLARYQSLPVKLPLLVRFIFNWYSGLVLESFRMTWRWRLDPTIIQIKKEIPRDTLWAEGKLSIACFFSKLLHLIRVV